MSMQEINRQQPIDNKADGEGRLRTYYPEFDQQRYQTLFDWQPSNPTELGREIEIQDNYTQHNVETMLGERFNVMLSEYTYDIKDNQIYGEGSDEPFIEVMNRGREFRLKDGKEIDRAREEAEVIGFKKIEDTLSQNMPPETIMVSISPPGAKGSTYQHNFYDIFTLKIDDKGKRSIQTQRYSSALSNEEYVEKISTIDPEYASQRTATPEDFLANPLVILPDSITADGLHEYFHQDHEYMGKKEFERFVLQPTKPFIEKYKDKLRRNPSDTRSILLALNAVLARSEEAYTNYKNKINTQEVTDVTDAHLYDYGTKEIPQRDTGCGFSSGYEIDMYGNRVSSPYSVAEFATGHASGERELSCTCPNCNKKVKARIAEGKITCPKCKSSAPYKC